MAVLLGRNSPLWNGLHTIVTECVTRQEQEAEQRTAELEADIKRLRELAGQPAGAGGSEP